MRISCGAGLTLFLFAVVATSAQAGVSVTFSQPLPASPEIYDFVEISAHVPGPLRGNPFVDARMSAVVRTPDGRTVTVRGFCDSETGERYKLRFMPSRAGQHRYSVTFTGPGIHARSSGSFVARPGGRSGILRVDRRYPFHFLWEGSAKHFFWNGTTAYYLLGFDDDAAIAAAIDRLGRLGVNRIRVALFGQQESAAGWNEKFTPQKGFRLKVSPWKANGQGGFDYTRFELDFFAKTERMLRLARDRDIAVALIFYLSRVGGPGDGDMTLATDTERQYYDYVVARLGAFSNVMWDLSNEYRHAHTDAWANEIGAFVKSRDPYQHLTSVHGHWEFFLRTSKWVDMALYQSWDDCGDNVFMLHNRLVQAATGRPIPQINDEYGYEDHYPHFGCGDFGERAPPARGPESRRRLAWRIAMAGGYQTTGERAAGAPVSPPSKMNAPAVPNAGGWINGLGSDDTLLTFHHHMVAFFTSFPWWKMEPRLDITSHGTLALVEQEGQSNRRVAIWVSRPPGLGGKPWAVVGPGRWEGRWFNPRTGESLPITAFAGPRFIEKMPGEGDWAAILERVGAR